MGAAQRVVSLVPSLTETLVTWGVDVVGRTRFCLHGDGERVGGTKDPDVGAVVALRPDLVVANKEENRADDVAALQAAGLDVVVTDIGSLRDAAVELRRLGALMDRVDHAEALDGEIEAIRRDPPTVAAICYIWRKPWMAVGTGTFAHDVMSAGGFANVVTEDRYPDVGLDRHGAAVALLPSEPYPFTGRQLPEVEAVFGKGHAVLCDGQSLTWYGPRTVAGVEEVRALRGLGGLK